MLAFIRRFQRGIAVFLLLNFLTGSFYNESFALTSGPSQPETQQFAPAGMDNLVDPFSGDFSYNIPLMDVGGYPVNLNYAAGITPDQEASWVGLGWNLNVGAINRSVRGLPDDFAGDEVTKDFDIKPNQTYGVSGKLSFEMFGAKLDGKNMSASLGLSANLFYNNYNGFGMSLGVSPSVSAGLGSKSPFTGSLGLSASVGSQSGVEVTPTMGLKYQQGEKEEQTTLNTSVGFPFSTREGMKGMSMSASFSQTTREKYTNAKEKEAYADKYTNATASSTAFQGFAAPTYTPALEHDMYNVNASVNLSLANSDPALDKPAFGFGGYYSGQFLKATTRRSPAYGYMYSGLSQSDDKLLDFNREKDAAFNKFTTNLAVTNFTYDIFQVSGQGIGGTYRLYRGDVGAVHDPLTTDQGYSPALGIDLGFGTPPSAKLGADVSFNYTQGYSGRWPDNNPHIKHFNSENTSAVNAPASEPVYFKKIGEITAENDPGFFDNVQQGEYPFRHTIMFGEGGWLNGYYDVVTANEGYYTSSNPPIPADNKRVARRSRNTPFTTLTAKEARQAAVDRYIYSYGMNDFVWKDRQDRTRSYNIANTGRGYSKTGIERNSEGRKDNHISEVRVTDGAGARYVYGIPAYNYVQEEVTFAKPGSAANVSSGIITYTPGTDDVPGNKNGLDHFYNKVSTPPYATSYLLTSILSADYVDRDLVPGPSEGDLGNYTRFNYVRAIERFPWRSPYSANGNEASYSEGMTGTYDDDKASYVYGEKEVWYLHSIETRTHVAEFHLKDRLDGLAPAGRHGGVGKTDKLQCLEKIVLYSKADKWNSKAEPVKTVYFDYDYSLCPGTPNSLGGGKLTLKKVWFTYGNSQKGVLNPYVFNYADRDFDGTPDALLNPSYDFRTYDRWGNYKSGNANGLSHAEFPYSRQDKPTADREAGVYALSSIQTPTGGTLRVYYESDDYAYVQNRPAMRMFNVVGAVDGLAETPSSDLFDKHYLVVDLAEGFIPADDANRHEEFRQKYLNGIDQMYYKVLLKVLNNQDRYEYIPGYATIDPGSSQLLDGSKNGDAYTRAVIRLNFVDEKDGSIDNANGVNPVCRNGWMFTRLRLNNELMGNGNALDNGLEQALKALLATFSQLKTLFQGFYGQMKSENHSRYFDQTKAFVRLKEPDKVKMGGGHRVKALVMVDNWADMRSDKETAQSLGAKETSFYGQAYDYTYTENGQTISAGVAAYEPVMGGEENPFRRPIFVTEKVPMAPSKEYFLEEPFGESFFPAPSVGYRKVVVTPLKITSPDLATETFKGNGTGRVEHEFYTAYDFPTITRQTKLLTERHQPDIISKFMKFDSRDLVTCSQGYYVELNDMHGKQRVQRVYPEYRLDVNGKPVLDENKPISEVEYKYRQNYNGTLNNQGLTFINSDLSISGGSLGIDTDVVQDERYHETTTLGGGLQFNLKYIQAAVVPLFVPTFFPDFNNEQTRFRSVVTTKVVNKYGILESTIARDNGASITTSNLAWDPATGQVLLTSVQNEFESPVYSFTYPAHWAYKRMGLAADNEGMVFDKNGFTSVLQVKSRLRDGDEVFVQLPSGGLVAHYVEDSGNRKLIKYNGDEVVENYDKARVIRSGARNIATTPVSTIVTLDNPIRYYYMQPPRLEFTRVVNAGAVEYKDTWNRFCNCAGMGISQLTSNPFIRGTKGNIRPFRSWTYLTDRTQKPVNNNISISSDGYYADFVPFWYYNEYVKTLLPPSSPDDTKWQYVTEIQNYNSSGLEIENRDALSRYSMAQFGYGRNLPVAVSNNSRYRESGFDGFEDYDYKDCEDDHLSWRSYPNSVTNQEAHTGRKSIKVPQNTSVTIEKTIEECGTSGNNNQ